MTTNPNDTDVVHLPLELLAEARQAASEEHRTVEELVSAAVRRYLDSRRLQRRHEHTDEALPLNPPNCCEAQNSPLLKEPVRTDAPEQWVRTV